MSEGMTLKGGVPVQDDTIPYGYCHCGCGQKTPVATKTSTSQGRIKGQPSLFMKGHGSRGRVPNAGERFGELVVVRYVGVVRQHSPSVECICDCGGTTIAEASRLRRGVKLDCGLSVHWPSYRGGHARSGNRHPLYNTWLGMRQRCFNPNYQDYRRWGGRGITICWGWRGPEGFQHFVVDMGERPRGTSIDRRNNDGHYSCGHCPECLREGWPANCHWATVEEQQHNKHDKRKLSPQDVLDIYAAYAHGRSKAQLARDYNVSQGGIAYWIRKLR